EPISGRDPPLTFSRPPQQAKGVSAHVLNLPLLPSTASSREDSPVMLSYNSFQKQKCKQVAPDQGSLWERDVAQSLDNPNCACGKQIHGKTNMPRRTEATT
ncbi:hypothetical protein H1C71_033023, partial [Ictidomys tridecemlineatus]